MAESSRLKRLGDLFLWFEGQNPFFFFFVGGGWFHGFSGAFHGFKDISWALKILNDISVFLRSLNCFFYCLLLLARKQPSYDGFFSKAFFG